MPRFFVLACRIILLLFCLSTSAFAAGNIQTLPIGSKAPEFNLPGIDGKNYSLESFEGARILVIAFICNHCPTSQAYEERLIKLTADYADRGVKLVGINPNNPGSLRYDELGWSDVGDSYEDMKIRARDRHFNFPYLYDGEMQEVSKKYGPQSTPHIFIFDANRILRYDGRIDDMENPHKTPGTSDARNAIEALLDHKEVSVPVTKVFGCSIKWLGKKDWIDKAAIRWAKEPVTLDTIGITGISNLMKNNSDKLVLINVWASRCDSCKAEFSDFVTLSRIYIQRDFEFISICTDDTGNSAASLQFLKKEESSGRNYLFTANNKNKLNDIMDPAWRGTLPYTILIEPGGKIVYTRQGMVELEALRKMIFSNPYIGRLYK